LRSQVSPETPFQTYHPLPCIGDVSQIIEKVLGITGPAFVEEGGFDLAPDRIGMMNPDMIQYVMARICFMGRKIRAMSGRLLQVFCARGNIEYSLSSFFAG